jgi:hypothetical protein
VKRHREERSDAAIQLLAARGWMAPLAMTSSLLSGFIGLPCTSGRRGFPGHPSIDIITNP